MQLKIPKPRLTALDLSLAIVLRWHAGTSATAKDRKRCSCLELQQLGLLYSPPTSSAATPTIVPVGIEILRFKHHKKITRPTPMHKGGFRQTVIFSNYCHN